MVFPEKDPFQIKDLFFKTKKEIKEKLNINLIKKYNQIYNEAVGDYESYYKKEFRNVKDVFRI